MTPQQAIDSLTSLARGRIVARGENDHTAAWMLGVRRCIEDLAANADAQRDTARLEYVMPILFMTREAIDFDMEGRK